MKLDKKVAVVTGAGQGLGRAIAVALALEGARVVVMSRSEKEIQEVATQIIASGGSEAVTSPATSVRLIPTGALAGSIPEPNLRSLTFVGKPRPFPFYPFRPKAEMGKKGIHFI